MATSWQWRQRQAPYFTVECPVCSSKVGLPCVTVDAAKSKRGPGHVTSVHIQRQVLAIQVKHGLVKQ